MTESREEFPEEAVVQFLKEELADLRPSGRRRAFDAVAISALSAIPWVGAFIAAGLGMQRSRDQVRADRLMTLWLEEHEEKFRRLRETLNEMGIRLGSLGPETEERMQTPEYLQLIHKGFRVWDEADTEEKRGYVRNLLTNAAGGARLTSDDVLRLFLDWLDQYHDVHFAVIRQVYRRQARTRLKIWRAIYNLPQPREDSAEADLFGMVIHDLSLGHVIRQERQTNASGQFLRKPRVATRPGHASPVLDSRFDDDDEYELTALGEQFVSYAMNEMVPRLEG